MTIQVSRHASAVSGAAGSRSSVENLDDLRNDLQRRILDALARERVLQLHRAIGNAHGIAPSAQTSCWFTQVHAG